MKRAKRRATMAVGVALLVGGLASSAWAVTQLAEGLRELPRHWWSSLAMLPLFAGMALMAESLFRAQRPPQRRAPD